ncbi:hybrid sensor histidine kinase/response regulator [Caulobacter mirabilis]|uniref:histidine kinase n=2 Tax=Caulobacter mirabilis TaxID=69666 RepID=A0A2D2AVC4_9CAUL|nr:hybrid sensor histidine kinase/response regulator [Caulobacter mirabilis]
MGEQHQPTIIGQDALAWKALVEVFYRQSYAVLFANFVVPLPVAWVLREEVSLPVLVVWIAGMYLLTAARVVLAQLHRIQGDGGRPLVWAWRSTVLSWASSLLWGLLGLVGVMPGEPHLLAFVCIVLTGLTCGAVPSLSAFPPAYVGSMAAMLAPTLVRCLTQDEAIYGVYVIFIVCLAVVNLYYCRVTYRTVTETVRLRSQNLALIRDLEGERDRAQTADRSKTRFLAAASHDLRQPIHALGLFAGALGVWAGKGDVPSHEAAGLSDRLKTVIGNLSGVLDGLLDVSKLDAGVVPVTREPVSLGCLFADLREEYAGLAQERGLSWRVIDSALWVDSDPVLLRRMIGNLVSNAFRYTRRGGVLLGVRRRGEGAVIQVVDSGPGIAEDQQELIFDEFVQLHNPERDRAQGLGLGLAIVRRTARLLGHPIAVRSVEGRGSSFSVAVPLTTPAAPDAPVCRPPEACGGLRILVVDDQAEVLTAVRGLLEAWGHSVHVGRDADAALRAHAKAGGGAVHLILADYRLGDEVTGREAVTNLRLRLGANLPAIVITGDTSPSRLREAADRDWRLLHKPVKAETLRDAIALAVG